MAVAMLDSTGRTRGWATRWVNVCAGNACDADDDTHSPVRAAGVRRMTTYDDAAAAAGAATAIDWR